MLFISGLSLFLGKEWAIDFTKKTFMIFWIATLFSWFYEMFGAVQIIRKKNNIQFSDLLDESPYTKKVLEKSLKRFDNFSKYSDKETDLFTSIVEDPEGEFVEELQQEARKMIIGKSIGFLVLTAILYLGWMTL